MLIYKVSEVAHVHLKLRQGSVFQVWGIRVLPPCCCPPGPRLLLGSPGNEDHPARESCLRGFHLSSDEGQPQLTVLGTVLSCSGNPVTAENKGNAHLASQ